MQGSPFPIITYQVITGNYSVHRLFFLIHLNYNIPSNNRELQQIAEMLRPGEYYNIPSNNRELQRSV